MPLSEQEQRLLEEMERSLYNNDSDFVTTMNSRRGRPSYTLVVVGILGALAGIAVIVAGVAFRQPLIGVAGFVLLLAGALFAIAPPRRRGNLGPAPVPPSSSTGGSGRAKGSSGGSMMDRLNQRWERRQNPDER
ncbi:MULTISPECIES: DUF3040 domain-containing protein [unclassified Frondihabitans]|jgi:hypothetical protein|uniref:DUF3040 domain-containing protein n=1 Tax=unclassified Frondihabitans TaxID=2626248 RepID=UPI0006F920B0|nr:MULTISPECIES: DUF3040 domain-containing protein [unclassified Frondihabitans]KQQ27357.1 hypothetical protein ASF54_00575 [Frondihabitans sp. Leaf304]RPE74918.1 DUF3040 family protein [Frondihabitans sp. PhB153]RPF04162.1 DUF3040 family protein [Frondihabitans sp. PhB161]